MKNHKPYPTIKSILLKAMFTFIFISPSYSNMVLIHWQAVCGSALFWFSPLPITPLHARVTTYFNLLSVCPIPCFRHLLVLHILYAISSTFLFFLRNDTLIQKKNELSHMHSNLHTNFVYCFCTYYSCSVWHYKTTEWTWLWSDCNLATVWILWNEETFCDFVVYLRMKIQQFAV